MDILTQYYNIGGQIVSQSPGMDTREFYRDVMCRHRFKEMFVDAKSSDGVGHFATAGGIWADFGNVPSAEPFAEVAIGTGSTSMDYSVLSGCNGRKAIKPSTNEAGDVFLLATGDNDVTDLNGKSFRLRSVVKLPVAGSGGDPLGNFGLSLYDKASEQCVMALSLGFAGSDVSRLFSVRALPTLTSGYSGSTSPNWSISKVYTSGFLFDGGFHVYDAELSNSGYVIVAVDGETIMSGILASGWVPSFTNPGLLVLCPTPSGVLLDSLSVEVI